MLFAISLIAMPFSSIFDDLHDSRCADFFVTIFRYHWKMVQMWDLFIGKNAKILQKIRQYHLIHPKTGKIIAL